MSVNYDVQILGNSKKNRLTDKHVAPGLTAWLQGLGGNDTIISRGPNNRIDGGDGNDKLRSHGGEVHGDDGNDVITVLGSGTTAVHDGRGSDTVQLKLSIGGVAKIFADTLDAVSSDTFINLNAASEAWISYADALLGVNVNLQSGVATGEEIGTDILKNFFLAEGGNGHDELTASAHGSTLVGGDGHDTLNGAAGNDHLFGGDGNDRIYGNGGNDVIDAGDGEDEVFGGAGNDTIIAGAGNDDITDLEGDTVAIDAGDGDDWITVSAQSGGQIADGDGDDHITIADSTTGSLGEVTIVSGAGADRIVGNNGFETIYDGAGGDFLHLNQNGLIVAFAENNRGGSTVELYGGMDTYEGSDSAESFETVSYAAAQQAIILGFSELVYSVEFGIDALQHIDGLITGSGDDNVYGRFRSVETGDGNDTVYTDTQDARTLLGAGDDTFVGGSGTDEVDAGTGFNMIRGGGGVDIFYVDLSSGPQLEATTTQVLDFEDGIDKIRVGAGYTFDDIYALMSGDGANSDITSDSGAYFAFYGLHWDTVSADDFIFG